MVTTDYNTLCFFLQLCFFGVRFAYTTGKLVEVWRKAGFDDISEKYDDLILSALTGFSGNPMCMSTKYKILPGHEH